MSPPIAPISSLLVFIFFKSTCFVDSVFSIPNPPPILKSPIPIMSAPEALSKEPSAPSKSIMVDVPVPVIIVCLLRPLKLTTVVLATLLFLPAALFMATDRSLTSRVSPSIPTKDALPTDAFRAVQVLRSVFWAGAGGAFFFRRTKAKSTSVNDRPIAEPLSAGPFTPAKAVTPDAPRVKRSTFVTVLPSASLMLARVDF